MSGATILHADLDAFYASVEQLLDPNLRGKPIAVGGVVLSCEPKAFGVRGGMPGPKARELTERSLDVTGRTESVFTSSSSIIRIDVDGMLPSANRQLKRVPSGPRRPQSCP